MRDVIIINKKKLAPLDCGLSVGVVRDCRWSFGHMCLFFLPHFYYLRPSIYIHIYIYINVEKTRTQHASLQTVGGRLGDIIFILIEKERDGAHYWKSWKRQRPIWRHLHHHRARHLMCTRPLFIQTNILIRPQEDDGGIK